MLAYRKDVVIRRSGRALLDLVDRQGTKFSIFQAIYRIAKRLKIVDHTGDSVGSMSVFRFDEKVWVIPVQYS
ncbi:hypothetical protein ACC699_38060, partial [Rhizobium ruizarguesonis]